jgi:WD40 repeat protein
VWAVLLWDFDTKTVARTLTGHAMTVNSVHWARNGRRLASASSDWTVILWDVRGWLGC